MTSRFDYLMSLFRDIRLRSRFALLSLIVLAYATGGVHAQSDPSIRLLSVYSSADTGTSKPSKPSNEVHRFPPVRSPRSPFQSIASLVARHPNRLEERNHPVASRSDQSKHEGFSYDLVENPIEPLSEPAAAYVEASGGGVFDWSEEEQPFYHIDLLARGYYLNDQRIQWSGQEETFGVEGMIAPVIHHNFGSWETTFESEFYLNQPFDRNVLSDTAERRSYAANFDIDSFEISILQLTVRNGPWAFSIGKMETPFGRTYSRLFSNARMDAAFIRTESILWRETGFLLQYDPGIWVIPVKFAAAITNGSVDRDTNSSKALVSRVGIETDDWALGASVKLQDGIGSEGQKMFNNHVGLDAMVRRGSIELSGEVIYDEYGFRRPGFDPDDITWKRSIYYRELNRALNVPISGVGYYVNLDYEAPFWACSLNYGQFHPRAIGDPRHDIVQRRGIVKLIHHLSASLDSYALVMIENEGYLAQDGRPRRGFVVLAGFEYAL